MASAIQTEEYETIYGTNTIDAVHEATMPYDEHEHRQRMVDKFREEAHGLFDALIVIGTWQNEGGDTCVVQANEGNWFAQAGIMQHALKRRETNAAIEETYWQKRAAQQDDDDGE